MFQKSLIILDLIFYLQFHFIQTNEKGVVLFKVESLQFRIILNPLTLQSLQLKVAPAGGYETTWDAEDIDGLEKFFEAKVSQLLKVTLVDVIHTSSIP